MRLRITPDVGLSYSYFTKLFRILRWHFAQVPGDRYNPENWVFDVPAHYRAKVIATDADEFSLVFYRGEDIVLRIHRIWNIIFDGRGEVELQIGVDVVAEEVN